MTNNRATFDDLPSLPSDFGHAVAKIREAVAAKRNVLIIAPPGVGSTMVARRLPGDLPYNDAQRRHVEAELDAHGYNPEIADQPLFRAPHHTVSAPALAGNWDRAGEAQLARHGILFLDGLPEFRMSALDALRDRLKRMGTGAPVVVATAHPCPCGWRGDLEPSWGQRCKCVCSRAAVERHNHCTTKTWRAVVGDRGLTVTLPLSKFLLTNYGKTR